MQKWAAETTHTRKILTELRAHVGAETTRSKASGLPKKGKKIKKNIRPNRTCRCGSKEDERENWLWRAKEEYERWRTPTNILEYTKIQDKN